MLSLPDWNIEVEANSEKARVGIYIKTNISYKRRIDLEGTDSNIIIIDLSCSTRIINVYRNFNPQGGVSARNKFNYQLGIISNALNKETILLGDFNLDYSKFHDINVTVGKWKPALACLIVGLLRSCCWIRDPSFSDLLLFNPL